jgi:hypothetical protein
MPTAATRVAPRQPQTREVPPRSTQRRSRPAASAPARPQPSTRTSQRPAPRRRNKAARRTFALLSMAVIFGAAVAAAVILATSTSNQVVHFRNVVAHDAQSAINQIRDIINGNKK